MLITGLMSSTGQKFYPVQTYLTSNLDVKIRLKKNYIKVIGFKNLNLKFLV